MSRKSHQQYFTEAIVGLFMIAVILLLAYFTIVISGVDIVRGKEKCQITVAFSEVGGLKDHDSVMYRGTKVGVVEYVEITSTNLLVHASVNRNLVLRESYSITVRNLSMLGGNYLHLEEGLGKELSLENNVFKGLTPTDWMQDMKEVAQNIRNFTQMAEVKSIVTNIESVSIKANAFIDNINEVAIRLKTGKGTLGKLTSDEELYVEFDALIKDMRQIIDNYRDTTPISTFSSLATGAL